MILFEIAIGILLLGILFALIGYKMDQSASFFSDDGLLWIVVGWTIIILDFIFILTMSLILLSKPYNYKNFKIEYETVKETITQKDDVRDATYTMQIIEINQEIKYCREFKDSKWIGIFQNEKICEMELLEKEAS